MNWRSDEAWEKNEIGSPPISQAAAPVLAVIATYSTLRPCFSKSELMMCLRRYDLPVPEEGRQTPWPQSRSRRHLAYLQTR